MALLQGVVGGPIDASSAVNKRAAIAAPDLLRLAAGESGWTFAGRMVAIGAHPEAFAKRGDEPALEPRRAGLLNHGVPRQGRIGCGGGEWTGGRRVLRRSRATPARTWLIESVVGDYLVAC